MSLGFAGSGAELAVGIAGMIVAQGQDERIVTHALGSCIALTVFDPVAEVGGVLHYVLDRPRSAKLTEEQSEGMFASTGVPAFFNEAYALGASKDRMIVCAAGAAEMLGGAGGLQIGKRNQMMLRKILWKSGVTLAAEDTGGSVSRRLRMNLKSGLIEIHAQGKRKKLWTP